MVTEQPAEPSRKRRPTARSAAGLDPQPDPGPTGAEPTVATEVTGADAPSEREVAERSPERRPPARAGAARGPSPRPEAADAGSEPIDQPDEPNAANAEFEVEVARPDQLAEREAAGETRVLDDAIVRVDLWATVVFGVVSIAAVVWSAVVVVAVVVDIGLFLAGSAAFFYAYFRAIGRSRDEVVNLAGLFFLAEGVAPKPIARALRLLLAAQVGLALATAAARPFSSLAFGVLAPMFGLALLGLWGAVNGRFAAHPKPPVKARRQRDQPREASE